MASWRTEEFDTLYVLREMMIFGDEMHHCDCRVCGTEILVSQQKSDHGCTL